MQCARGGGSSIPRGLLFLPIRDTQRFFRWELREQLANESKQASYASKDINEEERQDAVIFYIFLDFVLELGFVSFYGISALG